MHTGSSVINDIAVAIEKDNALCPLGIPPFNGVPSPNIALTITVKIDTITRTIKIVYGCDPFILFNNIRDISDNLSQNIIYPTHTAFIAVKSTAPAATFFAILASG